MSHSIKTVLTAITLGATLVACTPTLAIPSAIDAALRANSESTPAAPSGSMMPNSTTAQSNTDVQMLAALLAGSQNNTESDNAYAMNDSAYGSYADYSGYAGQAQAQPQEQDAWAGTCGANADYNEQLVCSGVPASMLP